MRKYKISIVYLYSLLALLLITQCSTTCSNKYDRQNYTGHYKLGVPYKIKNIWYYPKIDETYQEVGIASWYGSMFHCKQTANHEVFNKEQISAAHKTLPLPSVVTVTNLENGKSLKLVVNDRGPFVGNRIIDLSEKAAEKLDMKKKGIAKVKIKYEHENSLALHKQVGLKPKYREIAAKNAIIHKKLAATKLENSLKISKIHIENFASKKQAYTAASLINNLGKSVIYREDNKNSSIYKLVLNISYKHAKTKEYIIDQIIKLGYKKAKFIK